MRRFGLSLLLLLTVATGIVAITQHSVGAQQAAGPQSVTVSPTSADLSIKPGGSARETFKVINTGEAPFNVNLSVSPYRVEGIEYDPQFTLLPGVTESTSWVTVPTETKTVEPGETYEAAYTVSVPETIAPGGYYVVIFAESSQVTEGLGGVVPRNRVGNILYITVEGDIKSEGSASPFKVGAFLVQPVVQLGVKVTNMGGTHFVSKVKTTVDNILGGQVFNADVERYILPQTERKISVDWSPAAPAGIYKLKQTATVNGTEQEVNTQTIVHIQPWLAVVAFIVLTALGLSIVFRTARRNRQKASKDL